MRPEDLTAARREGDLLEERLGTPVTFEAAIPEPDLCTRDNCDSPMRAGIRIYKGANYSSYSCTMGFHIRVGTDEQFLTSGHCGYTGSNNWYHPGYGTGFVGHELATLYGPGGKDAMRVQIPDTQASDRVYHPALREVASARLPLLNETICGSLGRTDVVDCGTVFKTWVSWTSSTCLCTVWGGDYKDIASQSGDSGSPMYAVHTSSAVVAIGILANSTKFARVSDALSAWNAVVIT